MSVFGRAKEWAVSRKREAERRLMESAVRYVLGRMAEDLKGDPMIALLQGKKSYVTGVAMIAWGAWLFLVEGNHEQGLQLVLNGVGLMTLRAGVAKTVPAN